MSFKSVKDYCGLDYPGVYVKEHPTRKYRNKPDLNFMIRWKVKGESQTVYLGWSSDAERWTYAKAATEIVQYKNGSKKKENKRTTNEVEQQPTENKTINELTLSELFYGKFCELRAAKLKPGTLKSRRSSYKTWIEPTLGNKRLSEIENEDIERIELDMRSKDKSDGTIDAAFKTLQSIFTFAIRTLKYQGRNPLSEGGVEAPKVNNKRTRYLKTQEEAEILMNKLKQTSLKTYQMAMVCLYTGLRYGETQKLNWEDVNLEKRTMIAREPKNGRARVVVIPDELLQVLSEMKYEGARPSDPLFPRERGGEKTVQAPKVFKKVVDELGMNKDISNRLERFVWHSLRHSWASWLVSNGCPLVLLAELGGWSSYEMVLRYAHLATNRTDTIVDIFRNLKQKNQGN